MQNVELHPWYSSFNHSFLNNASLLPLIERQRMQSDTYLTDIPIGQTQHQRVYQQQFEEEPLVDDVCMIPL